MKVLQALALLAVIWLAGECAITVHQLRPKLAVTIENVDRATIAAGAAAANVEKASRAWREASVTQSQETTKAMSSVRAAASGLSSFISRTDNSFNGILVPQVMRNVEQQNASLLDLEKQLGGNLSVMSQATVEANKVLADADAQITNPALKESVDKFAESSANLATATREGAATMAKVHQGVEYEVNELMKPVKKVKVAILFIAQLAGKFLGY